MQLKLVPDYMQLIQASIESCINKQQLFVCFDFIHLFELRYRGWLADNDLKEHVTTLHNLYSKKKDSMLLPPKPAAELEEDLIWKTLGITAKPANPGELYEAYKAKATQVHPDLGGSLEKFNTLKDAYQLALKLVK